MNEPIVDAETRDALLHDVLRAAEVRLAPFALDPIARLNVLAELVDAAMDLVEDYLSQPDPAVD